MKTVRILRVSGGSIFAITNRRAGGRPSVSHFRIVQLGPRMSTSHPSSLKPRLTFRECRAPLASQKSARGNVAFHRFRYPSKRKPSSFAVLRKSSSSVANGKSRRRANSRYIAS